MTTVTADGRRLAPRLSLLSGEGALDVFARAQALEAQGRRVAHLELGEPDWAPAPHIGEALVRAVGEGALRYAPPAGLPELREAIAASYAGRGIPVDADQVLVTPGAKAMLLYAALGTIEPGDEVLVPDPGFPIYASLARFLGGSPVAYGLDASSGFTPDVEEFAERIGPRTRVLFLNTPHNPTGGGLDRDSLERVGELAARHDLTVISDEIYGALTYEVDHAASALDIPSLRERTIVVHGFSKTYAMTGCRLGFGVLPRDAIERFVTLAVNGHTCVPPFVQRAGVAALLGPQEPVRRAVVALRGRRDALVAGLNDIPGVSCAVPAGAFYAFPSLAALLEDAGLSAVRFADLLLEEHGIAVLPGTAFGARGEGHLRISFAASSRDIGMALEGIRAAVGSIESHRGHWT